MIGFIWLALLRTGRPTTSRPQVLASSLKGGYGAAVLMDEPYGNLSNPTCPDFGSLQTDSNNYFHILN